MSAANPKWTEAELAAAQKLVDAMAARKLTLSRWGAGFVLALYEAGKDEMAETFLDGFALEDDR